jgi:hypothetical protein
MKRLVLLGEGQGEVLGLPILIRRLVHESDTAPSLYVDKEVIRAQNALGLVKWDQEQKRSDPEKWMHYIRIAAARRDTAAVLAVFDGDAQRFPAGSPNAFCANTAAKLMAAVARDAGAGATFSLAIVFACVEYESWLVAGAESLAGKKLPDGRPALPTSIQIPQGDPESRGKGWLEQHMPHYRPTRDQAPLTELVNLNVVRSKNLRSFKRLENAIAQLLAAAKSGTHVSTPA